MFGSGNGETKRGSKPQGRGTGWAPRGSAKSSSVTKAQPARTEAVGESSVKLVSDRRSAKKEASMLAGAAGSLTCAADEWTVPSTRPRGGWATRATSSGGAVGGGRANVRKGARAAADGGGGGVRSPLQSGGLVGDQASDDEAAIPHAVGGARWRPARCASGRGGDVVRSGAAAGGAAILPSSSATGLGAEGATNGNGAREAATADRGRAAKPRGASVGVAAVRGGSTSKGGTRERSASMGRDNAVSAGKGGARGGDSISGDSGVGSARRGSTGEVGVSVARTKEGGTSRGGSRGSGTREGSTGRGHTRGYRTRGGGTWGVGAVEDSSNQDKKTNVSLNGGKTGRAATWAGRSWGSGSKGGARRGGNIGLGAAWEMGIGGGATPRVGTRGRPLGRGWAGARRGGPVAERSVYSDGDVDREDEDDDDDDDKYHDDRHRDDDRRYAHGDAGSNREHDERVNYEEDEDGVASYNDTDDEDDGLLSARNADFVSRLPTHPLRKLTPCQLEQVERETRDQSRNVAWFAWRYGRITASIAHSIAHCRYLSGQSSQVPESYVRSVMPPSGTKAGHSLETPAVKWGREMEAIVVPLYLQTKQRQLKGRCVVRFSSCGLYVDAERPWLAASPDGLVTLEPALPSAGGVAASSPSRRSSPPPPPAAGNAEATRILLEVKCPFKHRTRMIGEACECDRNFCLNVSGHGGVTRYELKKTHSYYTQVQCQLAVSRLLWADFVVYTMKDLAIVPVRFDPDFWKWTVERLSSFFNRAIRPRLPPATLDAVEWTAEIPNFDISQVRQCLPPPSLTM